MGGGRNRSSDERKSSSMCICNILKACFSSSGCMRDSNHDMYWDDGELDLKDQRMRICPSDEDRAARWIADPGIDRKASAFIVRFYASRVSDTDHQTYFAPLQS